MSLRGLSQVRRRTGTLDCGTKESSWEEEEKQVQGVVPCTHEGEGELGSIPWSVREVFTGVLSWFWIHLPCWEKSM